MFNFQFTKMRVSFNEERNRTLIMVTWSFAYRAARKSEWEMYARDRERFFYMKIKRFEPILNKVLDPCHRTRIFKQRFE